MKVRRALAAVWICFIARLLFYSSMTPLWEGYDEWAHFSVIRIMATGGPWLVSRDAPVPRDVEASLQLAPVPFELRHYDPPHLIQDEFWKLPEQERARRLASFAAMPEGWRNEPGTGGQKAYEALQPPLYYWLMTPVLKMLGGADLGSQVVILRWIACLIGSLAVPLVFAIGRASFGDDAVALGCAAVVALMPGFVIDLARVGNECVAVVLFSALILAVLKRRWLMAGAALGLGLLAKAYFLTAIPAMVVLAVVDWRRKRLAPRTAVASGLLAAAIGAWWYARNVFLTGTLSGLSESVMLRNEGVGGTLRRAAEIDWLKAVDSILLSHIYFGGWSSLRARSWMYHVFYAVILLAALGLLRAGLRHGRPLAFYAFFWAGQLYNVALLYASKGVAASMGWYMYAVVGAQAVLCAAGFRAALPGRAKRWALPFAATLFALLDLYAIHGLAMPYYSGLVAHKPNGGIAGLSLGAVREFPATFERLSFFKGPLVTEWTLAALWLAYLGGAFWILRLTWMYAAAERPSSTGAKQTNTSYGCR